MTRHKQKTAPGRNLRLADQIQKDLAIIIQKAKEQGFTYTKFVDLQFTGFNYGYILFFKRT
jgi:hypothetical protein